MTQFSDEILMAFADGELDPDTSAQVKAAVAGDAAMGQRVAQHRAMREDVYASFSPILDEAVPQRLCDALRQAEPAPASPAPAFTPRPAANHSRWALPAWGALAATLVVGVLIGKMALPMLESGDRQGHSADAVSTADGRMAAGGVLARAVAAAGQRATPGAGCQHRHYFPRGRRPILPQLHAARRAAPVSAPGRPCVPGAGGRRPLAHTRAGGNAA
ncbi:MAG: hypothetical protein RSH52_00935 [Janthinobacterium sp.]